MIIQIMIIVMGRMTKMMMMAIENVDQVGGQELTGGVAGVNRGFNRRLAPPMHSS